MSTKNNFDTTQDICNRPREGLYKTRKQKLQVHIQSKWVPQIAQGDCKVTIPIPNSTTDTHVNTVCHVQRTRTQDMHILLMTVLPHITYEFHSIT